MDEAAYRLASKANREIELLKVKVEGIENKSEYQIKGEQSMEWENVKSRLYNLEEQVTHITAYVNTMGQVFNALLEDIYGGNELPQNITDAFGDEQD